MASSTAVVRRHRHYCNARLPAPVPALTHELLCRAAACEIAGKLLCCQRCPHAFHAKCCGYGESTGLPCIYGRPAVTDTQLLLLLLLMLVPQQPAVILACMLTLP